MMRRIALSRLPLIASLVSSLALAGCSGQVMDDDAMPDEEDAADAELGTRPEDYAEVLRLAHQAGGLTCNSRAVIATAVARAESTFRVRALNTGNRNGSWDAGLWQINSVHGYSQSYLFDPENNAQVMARVSSNGTNFNPWTMYRNGGYRRYLNAAWSAHATYGCNGTAGGATGSATGGLGGGEDPPSGTCNSQTLGRQIPISECVESRFDSKWYQCTELGWVKLNADGTGYLGYCTARHPL